jgi:hypothetical protein
MDLHEVESIAKQELLKYGLTTWSFAWAKTKRRQGVCKYRSRRIEIAEYYARHNSREKVLVLKLRYSRLREINGLETQ